MTRPDSTRAAHNLFSMYRSTLPSSNPRSFCTCKFTSDLFIPRVLKVPCFQSFRSKSHLTHAVSAHPRLPVGGGLPSEALLSQGLGGAIFSFKSKNPRY